jgi:hypothetical protein
MVSPDNPKQWRIENACHLKGVRRYARWSETWNHDHREGCWAKFAEFDGPNIQHEGYATRNSYHWVCRECFEDLKDNLEWSLK